MNRGIGLVSLAALIAGCGSAPVQADKTPALIRCLERHGGERVTQLAQIDRVPAADPQYGTSYGLDSIMFESVDVDAGTGGARQALVFVEHPHVAKPRTPTPAEELRRAGRDDLAAALPERDAGAKLAATVVMPASADYDRPLSACAEEVAGDEISVP